MISSQIQQDSPGATQSINISSDKYDDLKRVIEKIKSSIDELSLEPNQKSELETELVTVEVQLSSPKPKPVIINESVGSIRRILEMAAASMVAQFLLKMLMALLT